MNTGQIILEIIKYTLPALVVFATVFFLFKEWNDTQWRLRSYELKQKAQSTTVPLKLTAYERLTLLLERITIPALVLRLRQQGMTAGELRLAMMITIQQEFEHNLTQQLYVSEQLWEIVKFVRDDSLMVINEVYEHLDPAEDALAFSRALNNYLAARQGDPYTTALSAVKKEVSLLL